ncbi:CPBP family intramembrane glutamic endopeptidase [Jeotgalibacillus proteolyticus]|uniref:CPBP family intramembrane metalloprotease n=1 Tax=Jeotgalibacillus proteolyticus TaxID=2082395 RepID=A0A2S5G675_9BACL|nr:type II CAAX endopeptidase family protein [Jeotgalibacillus proteolyticus]PPA68443.1 CPBP family intramembrane metalloprotease [Jeotgalibacillus proteolyticus]
MKRTFIFILIAYIVMQLSGLVGAPLLYMLGQNMTDIEPNILINLATGYWIFFSFLVALIVVFFLLRRQKGVLDLPGEKSNAGMAVVWSIAGIFIAFFSQMIAVLIETAIGIEPGSDNTADIISLLSYVPIAAFAIAIFGPILEEIVFRGVIFGWLYRRYNFFISGIVSAIIFAAIHLDFTHILIYTAMGFAFAFLYAKTKRIIVPIIAHIAINSFVVMVQFVFADQIERIMEMNEAAFIILRVLAGGIL